jgi:hypothetical protein
MNTRASYCAGYVAMLTVLGPVACLAYPPVRPMEPLVRARPVSFMVRTRSGYERDDGTAPLSPGPRFCVQAKRPACLRIEGKLVMEDAKGGSLTFSPYNLFVSNGITQMEGGLYGNPTMYRQWPAVPRLAFCYSPGEVTEHVVPDVLFDDQPLAGWTRLGADTVDGQPVTKFEILGGEYNKGRKMRRLFVSDRTRLPVRYIETFVKNTGGRYDQLVSDFSDWQLNPDIPDSVFDPTPLPGAKPEKADIEFVKPLGRPGMPAPRLRATTIDGKQFSLDRLRGKVVILFY